MQHHYIPKEQQETGRWTGGTTTQLFIFPNESEYKKLSFLFRISSARVEQQKSVFTTLKGIGRHLMILDGQMHITHRHHHQKSMQPFETDFFMGDWETTAEGCVTDFNLMLAPGVTGKIDHLQIKNNCAHTIDAADWDFVAIYAWKGSIESDNQDINLHPSDFIIFDLRENRSSIRLRAASDETTLICSFINITRSI